MANILFTHRFLIVNGATKTGVGTTAILLAVPRKQRLHCELNWGDLDEGTVRSLLLPNPLKFCCLSAGSNNT